MILKGKERKDLINSIAFGRAQFELDYAGLNIIPCNREYVVGAIPERYRRYNDGMRTITIVVSDELVRQVKARVPYMRRLIEQHS